MVTHPMPRIGREMPHEEWYQNVDVWHISRANTESSFVLDLVRRLQLDRDKVQASHETISMQHGHSNQQAAVLQPAL